VPSIIRQPSRILAKVGNTLHSKHAPSVPSGISVQRRNGTAQENIKLQHGVAPPHLQDRPPGGETWVTEVAVNRLHRISASKNNVL